MYIVVDGSMVCASLELAKMWKVPCFDMFVLFDARSRWFLSFCVYLLVVTNVHTGGCGVGITTCCSCIEATQPNHCFVPVSVFISDTQGHLDHNFILNDAYRYNEHAMYQCGCFTSFCSALMWGDQSRALAGSKSTMCALADAHPIFVV